jgi:hypothetical protein
VRHSCGFTFHLSGVPVKWKGIEISLKRSLSLAAFASTAKVSVVYTYQNANNSLLMTLRPYELA